jgi:hypothetical protein
VVNKTRNDKIVIREGKRGFQWKRIAPNGEPVSVGEPYTRLDGAKKGALRANGDLGPESVQVIGGRKQMKKSSRTPRATQSVPVTDVGISEPVDAEVAPPTEPTPSVPVVTSSPVDLPKIPDTWSRTIRTFLWAILALAPSIPTAVGLFNLPAETAAKVGGVVAVLVTVVTFLVNTLEEAGYLPPILKK